MCQLVLVLLHSTQLHTPASILLYLPFSKGGIIFFFTPDLPGNNLTLDDLGLLLEELMDVCYEWDELVVHLHLGVETVERIKKLQISNFRDRLLEVLKTWLTTCDNPSWKTISDALRSPRVRANRLAGGLESKYCLTKDMRESKQLTLAVSRDKDGQSVALSCDSVFLVYGE